MKVNNWISNIVMAYLALICIVPFSYLPGFRRSYFVLYLLFGLVVLIVFVREYQHYKMPRFLLVLGILFISMVISSLFSEGIKMISFKTCIGFLVRGCAFGVMAYTMTRYWDKGDRVFLFSVWLGTSIAAIALFEILTGRYFLFERSHEVLPEISEHYPPTRGIAVGAIGQPLPFSGLMVLFIPLSIGNWIKNKNKVNLIPILLMTMALFFTYRRSGYVLLILTIVIFSYFYMKKMNLKLLIGIMVGLLMGIMIIPNVRHHFVSRFSFDRIMGELKDSHRTRTFDTVGNIVKKHPLLGLGTRQYDHLYKDYETHGKRSYDTPDNQYLRYLSEGGLVGFLVFMMFIGFILRESYSLRRSPVGLSYFISLLNFSITLFLLDALYWPALQSSFLFVSGMAMGIVDLEALNA